MVNFPFKMFKIRFLRSSKCSKTTGNLPEQLVKLTQKLTTDTTALNSWYSYVVTVAFHYYAVIIEGL